MYYLNTNPYKLYNHQFDLIKHFKGQPDKELIINYLLELKPGIVECKDKVWTNYLLSQGINTK